MKFTPFKTGDALAAKWLNEFGRGVDGLKWHGSGGITCNQDSSGVRISGKSKPGEFLARLTGLSGGTYTWQEVIPTSTPGSYTNGPRSSANGVNAIEAYGSKECIVNDIVTLRPTSYGYYSFLYDSPGRIAVQTNTGAVVDSTSISPIYLDNAGPSFGQQFIVSYGAGHWYGELIGCTPPAKTCCEHGTRPTISVSVNLAINTNNNPNYTNIVTTGNITGPFTLTKDPYNNFFDCSQQSITPGLCGWAYTQPNTWKGDHQYYEPADDTFKTETLDITLVITAGVGLNNDYTSQSWLVVVAAYGCGHVNSLGPGGFFTGPYTFPSPVELFFGYAIATPQTLPADPLDCSTFPVATGPQGSGLSVSPS